MSAQNQTIIVDDHEVPSESIEQGNYNELNHLNTPVIIGPSAILNAVSSSATDNPILATPILSESAMNQKEEFVIASEDQQFSDNAASPSIDTQPLSSAEKISQSPPSLNTAEKAKDKYAEGHDSSNCQDATNDDVRMLSERLDRLVQENQQFRLSNDRLQYWLTALESENESIGEYIALYRFQRSSIQTRLSEKEKHLTSLQETHSVLLVCV
jgi:regulator of replication initiation timing